MKLLSAIFFLWYLLNQRRVQGRFSIQLTDIPNSAGTIISGLGKEIPSIIPTPEELFELPKQILFGLPEVAVFQSINKLCSVFLASDTISPRVTPDIELLSFELRTPCKNSSFPLTRAEEILESPDFDVNKKVVIFINGWLSNLEDNNLADLAHAYNCRGDTNFLTLNTSNFIATLYTWSAFNTEEIGRAVAVGLEKLVEKVPVENIHLIGLSLGAHIVGYAGRYFTENTGLSLNRITGLDPANPCFNEGESLSGLQRGDASFIDVIHTNPGALGKSEAIGDVDFYAGGLAAIKPGCKAFSCSHVRSLEYYIETVYPGNELNFLGVRCTSLKKVNDGFCNGPKYPMGFAVPHELKGNYFLDVNGKKPYGQNSGEPAKASECGKCNSE